MDRASILGDAINYVRELERKVNDFRNDLRSSSPTPTPTSSDFNAGSSSVNHSEPPPSSHSSGQNKDEVTFSTPQSHNERPTVSDVIITVSTSLIN